jgi:uncharacterized protein
VITTTTIQNRILKDLSIFRENINGLDMNSLTTPEREVVSLAKMYASDSEAWLKKKDYYTSFSSISYAHGLLDAILKSRGVSE